MWCNAAPMLSLACNCWHGRGLAYGSGACCHDSLLVPFMYPGPARIVPVYIEMYLVSIRPLHNFRTYGSWLRFCGEEVCGEHRRGFVRGRVIWDNVVELDTYLRMYATMPAHSSVAVLLDQAKAFTALDQHFLFKALARAGTLRRILRLLERLYERNEMAVRIGRSQPAYIRVTHGIKQGGPASARIWAICFESVLLALRVALGHRPARC